MKVKIYLLCFPIVSIRNQWSPCPFPSSNISHGRGLYFTGLDTKSVRRLWCLSKVKASPVSADGGTGQVDRTVKAHVLCHRVIGAWLKRGKRNKLNQTYLYFDEEANTMMLLSSSFWIICPWWEKGCLRMSPQVYLCPMSRDNWLVIIGCNYQDSGTSLRSSWRVWSPYTGADGFRATNENLNTDSHRDSKTDTNTA